MTIYNSIINVMKRMNKAKFGVGTMLVALSFELVVFAILIPGFSKYSAILNNLFIPAGMATVISLGMTVIMKAGGIDLSLGSIAGFAAMFGIALGTATGIPGPLAMIATLGAGSLIGGINGFLIGYLGVSPFVATLSMTFLIQGLEYFIMTSGMFFGGKTGTYLILPSLLGFLSANANNMLITALIWVLLVYLFLNRSRFGRYITLVGSNIIAAQLSGLNVRFYIFLTYIIGGIGAGLAGFMLASREGIVRIGSGQGFLIDAFLLPLLGKAVVGRLSVLGTILGALFVYLLIYGLMAVGASVFLVNIIKGGLLLFVIILSRLTQGGKNEG